MKYVKYIQCPKNNAADISVSSSFWDFGIRKVSVLPILRTCQSVHFPLRGWSRLDWCRWTSARQSDTVLGTKGLGNRLRDCLKPPKGGEFKWPMQTRKHFSEAKQRNSRAWGQKVNLKPRQCRKEVSYTIQKCAQGFELCSGFLWLFFFWVHGQWVIRNVSFS